MALGRYAYGRKCKKVSIKGRGVRCHCKGKFVKTSVCGGRKASRKVARKARRK